MIPFVNVSHFLCHISPPVNKISSTVHKNVLRNFHGSLIRKKILPLSESGISEFHLVDRAMCNINSVLRGFKAVHIDCAQVCVLFATSVLSALLSDRMFRFSDSDENRIQRGSRLVRYSGTSRRYSATVPVIAAIIP